MKAISKSVKDKIIKEYFEGKSLVMLANEYRFTHSDISKNEAEEIVYEILKGIKWGENNEC